jgi:hypothetical protein
VSPHHKYDKTFKKNAFLESDQAWKNNMAAVSLFSCSFPAIKNKIPPSRMGSLLPLFDFYFRHETFTSIVNIFC